MKTLQIITSLLIIAFIAGGWYTTDRLDKLKIETIGNKKEIKNTQDKMQGIQKDIKVLQEKVFAGEIDDAKIIISKSDIAHYLNIQFMGISENKIELIIDGPCDNMKTHSCETFFVNRKTGVISKF